MTFAIFFRILSMDPQKHNLKIGMLPKRVPSDLVFFKFSMDVGTHVPKIRVFLARMRCKFTSFRDSDEYRNI